MYVPTIEELTNEGAKILDFDAFSNIHTVSFKNLTFRLRTVGEPKWIDLIFYNDIPDTYPENLDDISFISEVFGSGRGVFVPTIEDVSELEKIGFEMKRSYFFDEYDLILENDRFGTVRRMKVVVRYDVGFGESEEHAYDLEKIREFAKTRGNVTASFRVETEFENSGDSNEEYPFFPKDVSEIERVLRLIK